MRQGIPDRRNSIGKELCPDVLPLKCGMLRVLESKRERVVSMKSTHEEDQKDKLGQNQGRMLI